MNKTIRGYGLPKPPFRDSGNKGGVTRSVTGDCVTFYKPPAATAAFPFDRATR